MSILCSTLLLPSKTAVDIEVEALETDALLVLCAEKNSCINS
jgi:hypothetical protein